MRIGHASKFESDAPGPPRMPLPLVRALPDDKLHYFTSKYTKTTKIPAFGRELLLVVLVYYLLVE
jgi:hypothetical protein